MKKLIFPDRFLWGSATSGPQSEGYFSKANSSIWDYWYKEEKGKFHNELGPELTSTFYKNFKNDIKLMKKIGHNSFRTSIQWGRVIKNFETGELDKEGVQFYKDLIDELIKNEIEPLICLFHFDMPMELQNIGGWENRKVVDKFAEYGQKMFELFGGKVKKWFTFNEPVVVAECGYLYQYHYPCVVDFKRAVQVTYNLNLASAKVIAKFKESKIEGDIGIILNLTPSYPRDMNNLEDVKAANICDLIFNRSFLDVATKGSYPEELISLIRENNLLPTYELNDFEILKNNVISILGVNYYQPKRIKARETKISSEKIMPENFFENYDMPGKLMNPHRGWEIYYEGIYDIGKNILENYGNIKWMITENGMGVEGEERFLKNGIIEDEYRVEFIREHLKYLHKSIVEGSNCIGYHMWTFIDCWSWLNSYKNRYGFISLDLKTQKREIKRSGYWYSEVSKNNGF